MVSNLTNAQALTIKPVDPVDNPLIDSLVGKLVGNGVIVENIRSNLSETSRALATFKADAQLLGGIRSGLMMVTGVADTVDGANNGGIMSNNINFTDTVDGCSSGRQMLNAVLAANSTQLRQTTDCATIQFDIIPATDSIKFNYVFASEEYNTFVCSNFNDIFGFFIRGPGISGDQSLAPTFPQTKNIALIPGTDLPVSINTVNNGTAGSGTPANCTFTPEGTAAYIDNTTGGPNVPFIFNNLKFNGLTTKLQAAVKVIPCETYTLTLTISDVTDRAYDSGVFIEAGSLRSSGVTLAQTSVFNTRFPYAIVDCNPGKFIFERCATNTIDPLIARYKVSGTAVNGVDYKQLRSDGQLVTLPDSFLLPSGQFMDSITLVGIDNPNWQTQSSKNVVIRFLNSSRPYLPNGQPNYRGDSTVLIIKRKFVYRASDDIAICKGTDSLLLPITPSDDRDRYRWVQLIGTDTIPTTSLSCTDCDNPRTFADSTSTYVLYVKDSLSGCVSNDTVLVNVEKLPELEPTTNRPNNTACRILDQVILIANPPGKDSTWTYSWEEPLEGLTVVKGGSAALNKDSVFLKRIEFEQFFKVKATNILGCESLDSVKVIFPGKPSLGIESQVDVCLGDSIMLNPQSLADTTQPRLSWRAISPNCDNGRPVDFSSYIFKPGNIGECFFEVSAENCRGLIPDLDSSRTIIVKTTNCGAFIPSLVLINGEIDRNKGFYIFQKTSDKNSPEKWPFLNGGRLRIYNRWGKEVYASDSYNNELSYDKLTTDYQDGVYFYEYDNREIDYKTRGNFSLQR